MDRPSQANLPDASQPKKLQHPQSPSLPCDSLKTLEKEGVNQVSFKIFGNFVIQLAKKEKI
jgi:hypothetical protein